MVEYRLDGPQSAPCLVLSNSLGTTWSMWDQQIPALTRYFRVLRYNTRGHGASALPATAITLDQLGQDVVTLLDNLDIQQASFCGISLGGLTGMWLNRYAGNRFQALVVANTAARIGTEQGWRDRATLVYQQGMTPLVATSAERWFTPDFCAQQPERVRQLLDVLGGIDPRGYGACCEVLATADLRPEAPRMAQPMLVIGGEQDPVTTVQDARWLVDQAPAATLAQLPASHLSNVECPDAFSERLISFFTQQGVIHG